MKQGRVYAMYLKEMVGNEYTNVKKYDPEYPINSFHRFPLVQLRFRHFQLRYHI